MFKPIGPRLLIKRIEPKDETEGGIKIPDQSKEAMCEAIVIAVGDGYTRDCCGAPVDPCVDIGDHIFFGQYSGTKIIIDGEEHLIITEEDVLGIYVEHEIDTVLRT